MFSEDVKKLKDNFDAEYKRLKPKVDFFFKPYLQKPETDPADEFIVCPDPKPSGPSDQKKKRYMSEKPLSYIRFESERDNWREISGMIVC